MKRNDNKWLPKVEATGAMLTLPAHQVEHARRRAAKAQWERNRTIGFVRIMDREASIDDRRIALMTGKNFYELKSFMQTLDMSLDKAAIMKAKEGLERSFVEERELPGLGSERVVCTPRHLAVYEYNPANGMKKRIA